MGLIDPIASQPIPVCSGRTGEITRFLDFVQMAFRYGRSSRVFVLSHRNVRACYLLHSRFSPCGSRWYNLSRVLVSPEKSFSMDSLAFQDLKHF